MPQNGWIDVDLGDDGWMDVPSQPQYEDEPSTLESFGQHWINQPLSTLPSKAASYISEPLMQFGESGPEWYRKPALYGGAFAQSVGDVLSGFTSPMNIATSAAFGPAMALGRGSVFGGLTTTAKAGATQLLPQVGKFAAQPQIAKPLLYAGKALSVPTAAAGVGHMAAAETWPEFLSGGVEAVGGGLGLVAGLPRGTPPYKVPTDWNIPGVEAAPPPPREAQPNLPGFATFEQPPPPPPGTGENYSLDFNKGIPFQADDMATHPAAIRPGMGQPVAPQQTRPPTATDMYGSDPVTKKPNVIIKKQFKPGELAYWLKNGYEAGGTNPDGMLYVVRQGFEDPFKGAPTQPGIPGTEPPQQAPLSSEVQNLMDRLRASVQQNAEARGADPGTSDDVAFERFFGDEESRVMPGEQTGAVARFPRPVGNIVNDLRNALNQDAPFTQVRGLVDEASQIIGRETDIHAARATIDTIKGELIAARNSVTPHEFALLDELDSIARERYANLGGNQSAQLPPEPIPDLGPEIRNLESQFRGELEGSLPAGSGARAMDIAAGRPVMDPRMAQRMQGNEWDFRQPEGPVQQGLPIPLELRQRNRLAEIADVQANTVPDPNQGNLFEDITNPVVMDDEPRFDRTYDPSIGGDARQRGMGTFENALKNSSDEELIAIRQKMADDVEVLKIDERNFRSGQAKRRVILAERKLNRIDTELAQRSENRPSYAVMKGGGYKASMNIQRGVENITKDYTSPIPAVQTREGIQNHLDAADKLGADGVVKIRLSEKNNTIEIYDNGGGMDDATIGGKLFEAFSTGKESESGATGGKGIGSASYIYGGKHFTLESVADDLNDVIDNETGTILRKADGKRYRIITSGTPEQFMAGKAETFSRTRVNQGTPTGTTMKVVIKDEHSMNDAADMLDRIIQNTRNRPSKLILDKAEYTQGIPLKDIVSDGQDVNEYTFADSKTDKLIGDFTTVNRNSKVQVLVPNFDDKIARDRIKIHYLNNGMYQFTEEMVLHKLADGVPEKILIDIHPLVEDLDELYPFINTREDIKKDIREEVTTYVRQNIANPGISKRKNRTQELYDSMAPIVIPGIKTTRKTVIYDPGNRFTPDEMTSIQNSPTVKALVAHYHSLVDEILASAGMTGWANKLEGVGMMFDRGPYNKINGIHIPNPTTGKSTILFNPFHRIEAAQPPHEAAWRNTITGVHEVAHIGRESAMTIEFRPEDMSDPRLGEWFQYYMEQLTDHGDVGMWRDTGHGMDFAHRLGYAYAKFGIDATHRSAAAIESILTGGAKSGSYSPEIQRLLHLYQESRGRPDVTEDILSGTGVKQADRGPSAEGNISSNRQANRNGATPTEESMSPAARRIVEAARAGGRGGFQPPPKPPVDGGDEPQMPTIRKKKGDKEEEKTPNWRNWLNLPRAATTIMDLSAPLRQGLPLIARKEWWTSWKQQFQALGSEEAFQKSLSDIKNRELFRDGGEDPITKKPRPSLAKRAGLAILDAGDDLTAREESAGSQWIETGGMFAKAPKLQKGYQKTLGRAARATNRAYQAYLNQLRADTFESLMKDAQNSFMSGTKGARDPFVDITYAKEIADFVNTATGRGPLRVSVFGEKEHDFEQSAKILSDTLFSPRLMASRVRMLSPATYMMASPFVRKQYLKAFLSVVGASGTMSSLAAMAGADVETDLTSADFGKIRIGDTRLDTAGGFQQYLVAASRLISGKTTSSGTGQVFELGQGYRAETRKDVAERFATNKLQPVVKFAYDLAFASQYQPFHVADRSLQMFIPLIVQDVVELAKENPALIPGIMPLVATGMGTQTYGKGESVAKFIPSENDWLFTGGALQNEIPNLWDSQEQN